ncbi:MAG: hypothetical protein AAFZ63_19050 [Bacteroidota bacterium]
MYPVVKIPKGISKAILSKPTVQEIEKNLGLTKPVEPKRKIIHRPLSTTSKQVRRSEYEGQGCLIVAVILSIILGVSIAWEEPIGTKFVAIGGAFIWLFIISLAEGAGLTGGLLAFREVRSYEKQEKDSTVYQKELNEYQEKRQQADLDYERKMVEYKRKKEEFEKRYRLRSQHVARSIYQKSLKSFSTIERLRNTKRGRSEVFFLEQLIERFRTNIKVDVVPSKSGYYYPDFVYVCNQTGLCIDIEIDEPYTMAEKEPIHYIGSSDEERDEFF